MVILVYGFKFFKYVQRCIFGPFEYLITFILFKINRVDFVSFKTQGILRVNISINAHCEIGQNFRMNNRFMSNPIGRFGRCSIVVQNGGNLVIGRNVGMSSSSIFCVKRITIGDNVFIGGNVVVYDTDFHSLNPMHRLDRTVDIKNTLSKEIVIGNNVFIGAHSTILKGVTIGDNAVIGACSVVTKSIPSNEVWAGNPAVKIKDLEW